MFGRTRRTLPVTVLSEFLGAGKTTLLNERLASWSSSIAVLLLAIARRPSDAALFERWLHEQEPGGIAWKKSERGPWKRAELARPWKVIRERAGMPKVIPYALRHSSIVRGLRKGLPIQQVAKLHNTSVKMIERHYAKYIATALEDLARAAVVSLVPRSGGNVVPMGKRA
jgi:hypothetical protein